MNNDLQLIERWAQVFLHRLQPIARRRLIREIAYLIRRSQQQRIAEQLNPDGSAFAPRKPRIRIDRKVQRLRSQSGKVAQRVMFIKLRRARWLKVASDAQGFEIGFRGPAARIAQVHQFGQVDRVAVGGVKYPYPVRQLLGLTEEERGLIRDRLVSTLAGTRL